MHDHMGHGGGDDDIDQDNQLGPSSSNDTLIFRILFNNKKSCIHAAKSLLSHFLIDSSDLIVGDRIGLGSSGIVYKGLYQGHEVAIKKLKGAFTDGSSSEGEFRREVLSLISCAHKNVVKLYGVCLCSDYGICIVTKFMEGGSLLHHLVDKKSLDTKDTLKLAKDVAKGMQFLHSRGIVHMDLKSANVFLDKDGNAVIGDFGVARLVNEKDTATRELGTYRWMAPEACACVLSGSTGGEPPWYSFKTDVYSFGILLWELVTCKMPYADYNPIQAAVGVIMHGLRPSIPASTFPPLRYLMKKCWEQNPSTRPSFSHIVKMLDIISLHEKTNKS